MGKLSMFRNFHINLFFISSHQIYPSSKNSICEACILQTADARDCVYKGFSMGKEICTHTEFCDLPIPVHFSVELDVIRLHCNMYKVCTCTQSQKRANHGGHLTVSFSSHFHFLAFARRCESLCFL